MDSVPVFFKPLINCSNLSSRAFDSNTYHGLEGGEFLAAKGPSRWVEARNDKRPVPRLRFREKGVKTNGAKWLTLLVHVCRTSSIQRDLELSLLLGRDIGRPWRTLNT